MPDYSEIIYMAYEDKNNPSMKEIPFSVHRAGILKPSKKTVAVGHHLRHACPEPGCNNDLVLRKSKYGVFYGCARFPACYGSHSAHQDTGQPMGTSAPLFTRKLRYQGHVLLEMVISSKRFPSKKDVYKWLADKLEIDQADCHFGMFDEFRCNMAISLLKKELHI